MKTYFLFIICALVFTGRVFSQTYSVKGQVVDSLSNEPLIGASVQLIHLPDSVSTGVSADKNGEFSFSSLKKGKYILRIRYIGYKNRRKRFEINDEAPAYLKISLPQGEVETGEVEIVGQVPPVVIKTDTTEFNADAFKTNKDATADVLISKIPGITVQDGKVQAQGEDIKKVLVDGKPFFGDDPNAVLKNVPAEIIDKVQVFDDQSEQSKFTGFDDGNTSKSINIVTRMRMRQGTFGRLSAGYGDEEKYLAGGSINLFNNDQRITVLSQLNNINEQNFSTEDLLGVMSGSGGVGGGGMGPRRGGGGNFQRFGGGQNFSRGIGGGGFGGRGSASDFLVNASNGVSTTKAFGVNYADKWGENIDISGSYFFNYSNNNAVSDLNREYFTPSLAGQSYFENNNSISKNMNHRFNMKLEYKIDTLNSILFTPKFSSQNNDGSSSVSGQTTSNQGLLNATSNLFNSNLNALNTSAELLYRHKFETKRRTISLDLNGTYTKNDGDKKLLSESIYYDVSSALADTLNQVSNLNGNGSSVSANLVYTEPAGENGIVQFITGITHSQDKNDQETFDDILNNNTFTYPDTALSNVYKKVYNTQNFGTGYSYQKDGLSLNANVNYNIASLQTDQQFPQLAGIEKTFRSVLPSFQMRYSISKDQHLRFNYRTNNDDPSVTQLQNVLNNSNPLQLSIGNTNLKQDYKHSVSLIYVRMNMENMSSLFLLLNGTFTNNYIGNRTIIAERDTSVLNGILLNPGTQITTPDNLDGYINLRSFITYGLPFNLIKSNLNFNLLVNYTKTPGIINNEPGFSNTMTYGAGFVMGSNFSEDLDFTIYTQSNINNVKSTLNDNSNNNYFNQNTRIRFFWKFWEGFVIQTDFNHQYNSGLSSQYNQKYLIWNASLGKKLLSNDQGEIRISVNDILNQNTNIQRNTSDSYFEDTRTNVLGRYFLLSFIYNLRAFK